MKFDVYQEVTDAIIKALEDMKARCLLHIYLQGYSGNVMPRLLRRLLAGSGVHRAWLCGHLGYFSEAGSAYGPAHPY